MREILINNNQSLSLEERNSQLLVNGVASNYEIVKLTATSFKVYSESSVYSVDVIGRNGKKINLSVNNQTIEVEVMDHMDQILAELGIDSTKNAIVSEVSAPMPGSILSIIVKEGEEVQSGDQLLILEAMKMENIIKSPREGVINKIYVSLNQSVEKNQVLISFK